MIREEKKEFRQELMHLAVPLALQSLLNALVGASDALMLGRLNQDAIAAVSLANQISFILSLFTGSAIGAAGVLIAQYWGKKDFLSAKRFLCMAIRYVTAISLVFFLAAFLFPESLIRFYTPEKELVRIGAGYLRIVSFSYLVSGIAQCYLMVMKIGGRVRTSLIVSVMTVVVDMVADFFLIYGFGKIPALGANGSAYSTIAVEVLALIFVMIEAQKKDRLRPDAKSLVFFSKAFEKDIWKLIPAMLASALSWGLSMTVHSFIMGHMGTDATAAASVTGVAQQLVQCVTAGLAEGSGIMCGKLLGDNQLEKARRYGDRFWTVSIFNGLFNAALLGLVGPLVLFFYVLEPMAKQYLIFMLIFSAFYMFAYAFNTIYTCGVFPAGGDAKYDAISVFFATWCFALPLGMLGCFVFKWPVMAVYAAMCCDEIIKLPALRWRHKQYVWVKNLTREQE